MNTKTETPMSTELETDPADMPPTSSITRRSFIKRTAATAAVTALALHAFRNEAHAAATPTSGVYGIVIVVTGPKAGSYTPGYASGGSYEERGQAIYNILQNLPNVTRTPLIAPYNAAPWTVDTTPGNPAPPTAPYFDVDIDSTGAVVSVNINVPAGQTVVTIITWGTPVAP